MNSYRESSENLSYRVGIDIGGTNIKAATINHQGVTISILETPTSLKGYEEAILQIVQIIEQLRWKIALPLEDIQGIGIGVPGFFD